MLAPATRTVEANGGINLARHRYPVGRWLTGETVEIICGDALVEIFHRDVLIVSHVARHEPRAKITKRKPDNPTLRPRRRRGDTTASVTRLVDSSGAVSFAGANYRVGKGFARRSVQVAIADGWVEISSDSQTIRTHPIHHDRSKEHGALATPTGRPRRASAVA